MVMTKNLTTAQLAALKRIESNERTASPKLVDALHIHLGTANSLHQRKLIVLERLNGPLGVLIGYQARTTEQGRALLKKEVG